jgi:acyl carrier protein
MLIESDVKSGIKEFILKYLVKEPGLMIDEDTSLLENGIIDSTGVMELVFFMESSFNIRVEDEEIIPDNLDSVNKLLKYVLSKMKT